MTTTYDIEQVELAPQPAAVVRGHVRVSEIPGFLAAAFGEVLGVLADQHVPTAGAPFARYVPADDGFDVQAGFPITGALTAAGRVESCELPGGPALRVLHRGSYAAVAGAYTAGTDWLAAHRSVTTAPPWECYLDGPEVPEPRTLVYLPYGPAAQP